MAPSKRYAPSADDEARESVYLEDGHGNSRPDFHRSKRRVSGPHNVVENDRSRRATSEIDTVLYQSTQFELLRDADDEYEGQEEEEDAIAAEAILSRDGRLGENRPADNGIIESVEVVNFMCHERLHVTLGPLINFIIGMNGSGKSAVLTAITLCLGAKASTTNRGGSLKSFIKEGREAANLIIKLKNEGEDAYQPHVFGKSIIVERHFTRAGTSGFKLKSAAGRIISTKRVDVDDLTDYFGLQIDNPMNVLSQDAARQFLNSSTASQKYKFFFKGVQLEQLDNDYQAVHELADMIALKLMDQAENLEVLRKKKDLAEAKLQAVENHNSMKDEYRNLRAKHAWVQVRNEERDLESCDAKIEEAVAKIHEAEVFAQEKEAAYQQILDAVERTVRMATELEADGQTLSDEVSAAKEELEAATSRAQASHSQQRTIQDYMKATMAKIAGYNMDIENEKRKIERASGGALGQLIRDIEQAQEEVVQAGEAIAESEQEKARQEQRVREAEYAVHAIKTPLDAKKAELATADRQLQVLNRDRGEALSGFDPAMPRLLQTIRNDSGFREKPVGPVGLHIKLLDPIWSNILERSLGGMLNSFIVTSKADQARLAAMMRTHKIQNCSIIIGKNQPLDTSRSEPDEHYLTVLRVLEIDNELVKRELIIHQNIEQSLLIKDRQEAQRVMFEGPRPRNVKQCFCLHDKKANWGIRLGYLRNGADQQTSPIRPVNQKPRMKTDIDRQIEIQRGVLEQLREEKLSLERRQRELEQAVQKCKMALQAHKRRHAELRVGQQRADEEVDRLQDLRDQSNVEHGHLESLRDALKEAEDELELNRRQYGDAGLAKEEHSKAVSSSKLKYTEAKERLEEHTAKLDKVYRRRDKYDRTRQVALIEKNAAFDSIENTKRAKSAAESERDTQATRVEQFIAGASEISPRVPVNDTDTAATIDKRMTTIKSQLTENSRRLGGTDEQIKAMTIQVRDAFNTAKHNFNNMNKMSKLLGAAIEDRIVRWRKFLKSISARARMNFMYLLSERGFRGKLALDHRQKLLELNVEPDSTSSSSKGRQTKTLSGGEKSFSSVCLLLALWEAMGSPLRCLDEFDVFMDNVNRDISTNMIVTAARRSVGRQYILITPNSIGNVEHQQDVKVSKLIDPRQRRLIDT